MSNADVTVGGITGTTGIVLAGAGGTGDVPRRPPLVDPPDRARPRITPLSYPARADGLRTALRHLLDHAAS